MGIERTSLRGFDGRSDNVGGIWCQSFRVYDRRALPVRGAARTVSGTAELPPKVGGPVGGAGEDLDRTRALEAPVEML